MWRSSSTTRTVFIPAEDTPARPASCRPTSSECKPPSVTEPGLPGSSDWPALAEYDLVTWQACLAGGPRWQAGRGRGMPQLDDRPDHAIRRKAEELRDCAAHVRPDPADARSDVE